LNPAAGPSATPGALACGRDVRGGGGGTDTPPLRALPIVVAADARLELQAASMTSVNLLFATDYYPPDRQPIFVRQ
jgi:hypothetical protein